MDPRGIQGFWYSQLPWSVQWKCCEVFLHLCYARSSEGRHYVCRVCLCDKTQQTCKELCCNYFQVHIYPTKPSTPCDNRSMKGTMNAAMAIFRQDTHWKRRAFLTCATAHGTRSKNLGWWVATGWMIVSALSLVRLTHLHSCWWVMFKMGCMLQCQV